MTQAQLGASIGVSQARIAEIEANPGVVSVDQMLQILSALDITLCLTESTHSLPQEDDVINHGGHQQAEGTDDSGFTTDKFEVQQLPQADNSHSADTTMRDGSLTKDLISEKHELALTSGASSSKASEEAEIRPPIAMKSKFLDSARYAYRFNLSTPQNVVRGRGALGVANTVSDLHEKLSAEKGLLDQLSANSQTNKLMQQPDTYEAFLRSQPSLSARDSISQQLAQQAGVAAMRAASGIANPQEKFFAQKNPADQPMAISQANKLMQETDTYDVFRSAQPSLSTQDLLSQKLQPPKGTPVDGGTLSDYLAAIKKNKKGSW